MGSGIYFPLSALLFSFLTMILFFTKKHIPTGENKLYGALVVVNFFGLIIELLCTFAAYIYDSHLILANFILKSYLIYIVTWAILFTVYVFYISHDEHFILKWKNRIISLFSMFYVFSVFLVSVLPVKLVIMDNFQTRYTEGLSVIVTYVVSSIAVLVMLYCIMKNRKNLKSRKYIPLFVFLSLGSFFMFFQMLNPQILVMTYMETFITVLMYHTIENPDMKLLEEVHKAKEISDAANEEKTMFLYNMTQEIRSTTDLINANADMILESDSLDDDKDCAREIKGITSKFNSMTNEMFDVSKLDAANIKVYNSKYNVKNILKEIVTIYNKICREVNLDFRVNIDHDVPEVMYGDSIGLKEVLNIILDNSVKYTKDGFIEFDVNTIVKNDVCRLIITIEDSGSGIKSEDINKMKVDDKSLSKANKLVTLMNGTMMISSNYGFGTKVKIVLDQKIEFNINETVAKYEEIYEDIKMLMVDDSDSGIKIIDKLIKGSNIKMDFATNGKECINKIKAYEKYNIILLDEQLSQISAMELIKKIRGIKNFNIPVILLTKDNSYEYNDEFKKLGFSDYLLKPIRKEDLLNKINEYAKKDK